MNFLLKDAINGALVDSVYNEIFSRRSNYYYYIGRIIEWTDPDDPEDALDTFSYEQQTRNTILTTKKIQVSDVSYVIPRNNWTSGLVYDQYDGDYSTTFPSATGATSLKTSLFYVLSSDFNVYKCLSNNRGAISTVSPTGTDALPITTADGYLWKFMYTIPLSLRNKFLSDTFMPVQKAVFNSFYSNGEIDRIIIDNPGIGYFGNAAVTLQVNGEFLGSPGNVVANIVPVLNQTGQFVDVIIRDRGNNYLSANITIIDDAGTGTGYYNTLSIANLTPVVFNTQIDRVVINDPGINYSSNLRTRIATVGDGVGVSLLPFINAVGELEDIVITSRGEGFTFLDIDIIGNGTGANARAELSTGDLDTTQSTVELAAIPGALYNFRIVNGGNGYTSANIVVVGDGTGFIGNVELSNANTVSGITIVSPGSDYTFANVTITGNGSGAVVQPIISPQGGHGSNAVKELFADSLVFFSTINNERIHGVDVNNDYRQFGIIKDIKQFANAKTFANVVGTTCYLVTTNTVLNSLTVQIAADTILELNTDSTKKFEVVEVVSANTQLLITNINNYDLSDSDILYDPITDSNFTIQSIDELPDINKFSGDLLFIDNRTQVSYSDQQLVTLRTTIKL